MSWCKGITQSTRSLEYVEELNRDLGVKWPKDPCENSTMFSRS